MLGIIIPTLNTGPELEQLLIQLPKGARIVIADGGSEDATLEIAARYGLIAMGGPGRGGQLRRGAAWAQNADWLLFIHADCQLPAGWEARIEAHKHTHPDKAGYFDLRLDSSRVAARFIEAFVRVRCRLFGLPYGDQGLLISRALYDSVGGFEDIPLFEDVAMVRALGKARLKRLGAPLLTDASKFERDGFFRRGWRNFRLLRRYLKGETPDTLAKAYT